MMRPSTNIFLGCVAGAIAVLVFHQTTLQFFFWLGLAPHPAFRVAHVPPFNAPMVASMTFWGAVYGGVFGALVPWIRGPLWLKGAAAGLCAMAIAWFVFLPLMGQPAAFGWQPSPMLRSVAAYQMWGLGLSLLLPVLHPRRVDGSRPGWSGELVA
jgi:hypothetical protein